MEADTAVDTPAVFADPAGGTGTPAAVRLAHGEGRVTAWAFDVARNVACIRQGNPDWVGTNRDEFAPIQLIDSMAGWIRPERLARPDADLFQQALSAEVAGARASPAPTR